MMHEWIQSFVMHYGLFAVFFIVMLESAGLPLPGETALILASIYAGMTGHLNIGFVIGVTATAAILGDNIGFWIGRKYGLPLLQRHGTKIGLTPQRLEFGQYMFCRHGAKIVFYGRFIAFLRIFAAVLAGANKYPWRTFLFYNAAGGICWSTLFGLGGYFFGESMQKAAGPIGLCALGVAVGGLVVGFWIMRRQEHLYEARALAEMKAAPCRAPAVGE